MKKQSALKAVNLGLALSFLWVVTTAALRRPLIKVFDEIHPIGGFVLTALVITHVILNWPWVKSNYLPFLKRKDAF